MEKKNIYQKLMNVRTNFHKLELKKSGHNKFANFKYFELGDFLVPATKLLDEEGLCPIVTFDNEVAKMVLVNTDNPSETIEFTSPMRDLELKGANSMQSLGGCETYQTRYLYIQLLNIVESDSFDAVSGKDDHISEKQVKRLYVIAKGKDFNEISKILDENKFKKFADITKDKYEDICARIDELENKGTIGA
jgi:putative phage essential recombination function protein